MGWHHPAGAGEDGPLHASSASEGIRPGEGNFLLLCKGASCRQSFIGLALSSQGLPWVAEGSGMVVSWAEAGAASEAMDEGDCCRNCSISIGHDPIGSHVFFMGEGRRTLIGPHFSYCYLWRNDQATFCTPGCAWGFMVLHDTFLLICAFSASLHTSLLSCVPDPFLGSPFNSIHPHQFSST